MRLDKNKFRQWLEAKKPGEIVGNRRDCIMCPLGEFFSDVGGYDVVISENGRGYKIDRGGGDRQLPWWAENFAFRVDCEVTDKITARQALHILDMQDR